MSDTLLEAIGVGDAEAVLRLATPETVNAAGPGGVTPLMRAAVLGRAEMVTALLARGAAVNAADERDFTPLFYGCYDPDQDRGHPDVVELLLAAGADKEAKVGFGVRPLMYAAGNGEAGVVEVLLRAGADPLARNEVGRTALMMVKDRDYVDVINLLHEAEAMRETAHCGSRVAPDQQVITFRKPAGKA
jgi:ankyrin repeat protein